MRQWMCSLSKVYMYTALVPDNSNLLSEVVYIYATIITIMYLSFIFIIFYS